jgi:hypothetical protein
MRNRLQSFGWTQSLLPVRSIFNFENQYSCGEHHYGIGFLALLG